MVDVSRLVLLPRQPLCVRWRGRTQLGYGHSMGIQCSAADLANAGQHIWIQPIFDPCCSFVLVQRHSCMAVRWRVAGAFCRRRLMAPNNLRVLATAGSRRCSAFGVSAARLVTARQRGEPPTRLRSGGREWTACTNRRRMMKT